jgi:hypothetical protein
LPPEIAAKGSPQSAKTKPELRLDAPGTQMD